MRTRKLTIWRRAAATAALAAFGVAASATPIPTRACLFLQEFESSSKAGGRVSLVERVVYSLIQAKDRETRDRQRAETDITATPVRVASHWQI